MSVVRVVRPGRTRRTASCTGFAWRLPTSRHLIRARNYLADVRVATREFAFQAAVGNRREVRAISASGHDRV